MQGFRGELIMGAVILTGLFSAFLILFVSKIGGREYVQMYGNKFLSRLFGCDFCLSFWFNLILSIILYIFVKDATVLLYCFVSTPITRVLI